MTKVLNLKKLKEKILFLKKNKKKIVHCHGVFDLVHYGHIQHFKSAKSYGDCLIVTITSDKLVNKGPGRPYFNQDIRSEFLSSIDIIDFVAISESETAEKIISIIKPDIYFKGPDYKNNKNDKTNNIYKEVNLVKKFGGKTVYSKDVIFSSSQLLNKFFSILNSDQKKFINAISKKYSIEKIENFIKKLAETNALLIGEIIIDEYVFCETLGKSGKEPHLAVLEKKKEMYLGGSGAIANNLSTFCKNVNLLSYVGEKKENIGVIKKLLNKKIKPFFVPKLNSPTILKKRFVDKISGNKLLGVYSLNDNFISKSDENKIIQKIKNLNNKIDTIIISDYGHGLLTDKISKTLVKTKKFIAVNAQVNAANIGYNSLKKYQGIDALIINESELRQELRDKNGKIDDLSKKLLKSKKINYLLVTRGKNGANLYTHKKKKIYVPAFASKIVDKVGAGDTMLSIVSISIKNKVPLDLALLFGSLAGAQSVESFGNSQYIDKKQLFRSIEYLIK